MITVLAQCLSLLVVFRGGSPGPGRVLLHEDPHGRGEGPGLRAGHGGQTPRVRAGVAEARVCAPCEAARVRSRVKTESGDGLQSGGAGPRSRARGRGSGLLLPPVP